MCDALDERRKDSYNGICEASVKMRWIESESDFVDVRSGCHLKNPELACVVILIAFESLM